MICAKCNFQNEETVEFCKNCDEKLIAPQTQPETAQTSGSQPEGSVKLVIFVIAVIVCVALSALMYKFFERTTENPQVIVPADFIEPQYGIEMMFVLGGTFIMGCTPEQEDDCMDDERPVREVTLSDFYIGKYEITQAQWTAVMGADNNPSAFRGDNLPVERVSWNEVREFIEKLNGITGGNYRLPTEAEWEYAARGGAQSRGYKYSGSNTIDDVAWYWGNSGYVTNHVGTKRANELGIHDMSGNVYEWVLDWYGHYNDNPQTDPRGPVVGMSRVIRGGSWYDAWSERVTARDFDNPDNRGGNLGFRLARGLD